MSLPWIRFDTAIPDNPKILHLIGLKDGRSAGFVFCCGLAYSGKHGTDGFIPREALSRINGRPADAERLVEVGLWYADDFGAGWIIPDWAEYQESNEATKKRRLKAQTAARARWDKPRAAREDETA